MKPVVQEMGKRPSCAVCLRAQVACICACVKPVANTVEVLILQHPDEAKHIKSSGRLLHLCLPNSVLQIGLRFDPELLQVLLHQDQRTNLLLYPESPTQADTVPQIEQASTAWQQLPASHLRLIVIDASWRQSRAMLRQNPSLEDLPRLALRDTAASRYVIRQAHSADQLSSLEACAYALQQLERSQFDVASLLQSFDQFNAMQIAAGVHRLRRQ